MPGAIRHRDLLHRLQRFETLTDAGVYVLAAAHGDQDHNAVRTVTDNALMMFPKFVGHRLSIKNPPPTGWRELPLRFLSRRSGVRQSGSSQPINKAHAPATMLIAPSPNAT
jgi:hypothetical protein